ncbi:MAG: type I DNA topoisomerase [Alphaproteobacteria bacterium]|nr:type I DNA topoisomerase [Alphaproteobacteria bacterium]
MSAPNVVIVESPSKAKTINKYLGKDYIVLASMGHVRDLPSKNGSVDPDQEFEMKWEVSARGKKTMKEISDAVKGAKTLYLAMDPDREGEAIAWHVQELLEKKKLLKDIDVHRVAFNQITKRAVNEAFAQARQVDIPLVEAYLARRALDYLVGFNLSPVLWRKLPGSKSAGRVQSVALRLICERESEIEKFIEEEYWSIEAQLQTSAGAPFMARLTHLAGNRLDKMDIGQEADAKAAVERIMNKSLTIQNVTKKQVQRKPYPPFITSTLQQEASRKIRFSASQTMRIAQQLYEGVSLGGETVGLITYMRTDGITLSEEAITQAREVIGKEFGEQYRPNAPRVYKSKAKNAQEAHEAIRPSDLTKTPKSVRPFLDKDQFALYDLIWKRTIACQMENAIMDQVRADISDGTDDAILRATGSTVAFDGFLTLYREDKDDDNANNSSDDERRLPPLIEKDNLKTLSVTPNQHFTQAPPRYTEASLVKIMEEKGIGRPSTYASILQVLRDRDYVRMDARRFFPEDRGRIVTEFLKRFFSRYVDYDFTANLEQQLDAITEGQISWKETLSLFWIDFKRAVDETKELRITEVIDHLNDELSMHFFPVTEGNPEPRKCPSCKTGKLSLKLSKNGAFIGCENYPDCKEARPLSVQDGTQPVRIEPTELGFHPDTKRAIFLKKGPYGPYVEMSPEEGTKDKPKRQGLPKGLEMEDVTLEGAVKLLSLPRDVGLHPETKKMIQAGIGRFGPFVKHDGVFVSIPKSSGEEVLMIGINRSVDLIAVHAEKRAAKEAAGGGKKAPAKKKATKKPAKKAAKKKPAKKKTATKKKA